LIAHALDRRVRLPLEGRLERRLLEGVGGPAPVSNSMAKGSRPGASGSVGPAATARMREAKAFA